MAAMSCSQIQHTFISLFKLGHAYHVCSGERSRCIALLQCPLEPANRGTTNEFNACHHQLQNLTYTGCGKLTSFFIWHFIFKKGS
jgi:hypothetical protein